MKHSTTLAFTALVVTKATCTHLLSPRDEASYIDSVCSPNTTSSTAEVAPCIEIQSIEIACTLNGTTTQDYLDHQQCICGGSFFSNWLGCLNCQYVHGARSEAVVDAYENIISSVSVELCTGTPTADFADLFSSVSQSATLAVAGEPTTTSDLYPSDAAISLYYTASGSQGPGVVTGQVASATAAATTSSGVQSSGSTVSSWASSGSSSSSSRTSSTSKTTGTTSTGTAAAATTSSTATGAAVVNGVAKGLLALAAGAVVVL